MRPLRSTTEVGLTPDYRGKVRDVFDLGDRMFIVSTDRISAYDVIMDEVVPGRGVVLTVMSLGWFAHFADIPNHIITADPAEFPAPFNEHADALAGRAILVHKADRFDVECIVRGYITGSGWKAYEKEGAVCGIELPDGLLRSQKLAQPLYTPSTKAETGHDENISFEATKAIVGGDAAARLRDLSLRVYGEGADYAATRGVLVADTKFEFGLIDGKISLIDEVLTPDSSRFWPADQHRPGEDPPSWDKQILRNHLDTLVWNHEAPPPKLAADVLEKTSRRYREVLDILFPAEADKWQAMLP